MFGSWWRRHCNRVSRPMKPANGAGQQEAQLALDSARQDLRQAKELSDEAQPHINTLRRINQENHFAQWAWRVFEGGSR